VPDIPDLADTIATASTLPKSATGDNGSATQHDLSQLIEADRYLASKKKQGPGFKLSKIVPGGSI
jgi:hypothetical protein